MRKLRGVEFWALTPGKRKYQSLLNLKLWLALAGEMAGIGLMFFVFFPICLLTGSVSVCVCVCVCVCVFPLLLKERGGGVLWDNSQWTQILSRVPVVLIRMVKPG